MNLSLDYSTLFSSLSSSSSSSSSSTNSFFSTDNTLSTYASIKNGSYSKLMKAYYASDSSSSTGSSTSTSVDSATTIASIQSNASSLSKAADALITKGTDSLFNKTDVSTTNADGTKTTTNDYDMDAIYKAVSSFTDSYNNVLDSASNSSNTSILRQATDMTSLTSEYSDLLSSVGVTIGSDNKLTVDEDTLKSADISTLKTLFNGNSSYAYSIQAASSQIGYAADNEASQANTYTTAGSYSNSYLVGSLYGSFV